MDYLWFKAFHLIFLVTWFAGLFYIFRLFVYHVQKKDDESHCQTFSVMEKKLIQIIMHPSLLLAIVFGLAMLAKNPLLIHQKWFVIKLTFVVPLLLYHAYADFIRRRFARGDICLSERACRLINEIPSIILIANVILAVVKPWR